MFSSVIRLWLGLHVGSVITAMVFCASVSLAADAPAQPDFGEAPATPAIVTTMPATMATSVPASMPASVPASAPASAEPAESSPWADVPQSKPAGLVASAPAEVAQVEQSPADKALAVAATKMYQEGIQAGLAGNILDARAKLSEAMFTGQLDHPCQTKALEVLTEISERTLLNETVTQGDPYTYTYKLARGDTLARVVQRERLNVTPTIIQQINRLDPSHMQTGMAIKLIRGPACAIVTSKSFTMDIYLQLPGEPKAFLKQVRVGLGRDGTPTGDWLVARKTPHANWTPTASMTDAKPIAFGQKDYPLGKDGYWISLQGTDERTKTQTGYGIHGTNEPDSIGKAASHGCVRLADDDIEFVYSMLAAQLSTVVIR
jgi:lipoprotein-anchoring transpeptidase ErfK/SrfK